MPLVESVPFRFATLPVQRRIEIPRSSTKANLETGTSDLWSLNSASLAVQPVS